MKKRDIGALIRIVLYIVFLGTFMLLPVAHFLTGEKCSFEEAFNMISPSCGVTRAFSAMMHGDIGASFYFNPYFTLFLGPFALFVMAQDVWTFIMRQIKKDNRLSLMDALFEQVFPKLKEREDD